ncbi:hypothetical protein [Methylobacterium sp. CM6257]
MIRERRPAAMLPASFGPERERSQPSVHLQAPAIRFRIDPAYVPADKIARRLHLTEAQFEACRPRLFARGFPTPDETTGMYDLEAVDRWRKRQRPDLYPELTAPHAAADHHAPRKSMGDRFVEAKERRGHG